MNPDNDDFVCGDCGRTILRGNEQVHSLICQNPGVFQRDEGYSKARHLRCCLRRLGLSDSEVHCRECDVRIRDLSRAEVDDDDHGGIVIRCPGCADMTKNPAPVSLRKQQEKRVGPDPPVSASGSDEDGDETYTPPGRNHTRKRKRKKRQESNRNDVHRKRSMTDSEKRDWKLQREAEDYSRECAAKEETARKLGQTGQSSPDTVSKRTMTSRTVSTQTEPHLLELRDVRGQLPEKSKTKPETKSKTVPKTEPGTTSVTEPETEPRTSVKGRKGKTCQRPLTDDMKKEVCRDAENSVGVMEATRGQLQESFPDKKLYSEKCWERAIPYYLTKLKNMGKKSKRELVNHLQEFANVTACEATQKDMEPSPRIRTPEEEKRDYEETAILLGYKTR